MRKKATERKRRGFSPEFKLAIGTLRAAIEICLLWRGLEGRPRPKKGAEYFAKGLNPLGEEKTTANP